MPEDAQFFNRELSWLAFNRRVLEEAEDDNNPLLERARFLAIVASNLDEFCMVRLAELYRNRALLERDPAGLLPSEQLEAVRSSLHELMADQYACWRSGLQPALAAAGLTIVAPADWSEDDRTSLASYYRQRLEPTLTPLAVDPTRPFPPLAGGGIHIGVLLHGDDGDDEAEPKRALVTVAGGQRLIGLVQSGRYALLEDVVEQHLEGLFPGYRIIDRGQFRVTRDASIEIEEDQSTDLLQELEEELRQRGHGRAVRLELGRGCPDELQAWLMEALELDDEDRVAVDGPLDLSLLFGIDAQLPRPELRFAPFQPRRVEGDWSDPFQRISDGDLLLHHPFESFQPVVELVERAADDPRVLAIKQTLYRVSGDSPVVAALVRAAQSGKQVTVLVELKARFDEARNIRWARRLEEAGAHVLYGLVGMKVHAKLLLIIRRDEDGIRRYCHLGTGNYNDRTAHLYTDIGVLTSNDAVGRDVAALFNMLTGFSSPPNWERLAVAPLDMRRRFYQWIDAEIAHARAGRNARIVAKFNSLVDVGICERLYAASQAGVQIDLVVRGMCTLRPGVPGLSENIRVRSVIGRFLEHSRIYCFAGGGEPLAAIASADWMTRNLDRRVESLLLVEDPDVQRRLLELVELYLADNCSARELQSDGSYRRLRPTADEETLRAQDRLLAGGPRPQAVDDRTPRAAFQVLRAPRES